MPSSIAIRRAALLSASAAALTVPAAAHAAPPTVLSAEQAPATVAAWSGTTAWSSLDPATKGFRLVVSEQGAPPVAAPVAQRDGAFDVDLGTSRSGATYAVYSRAGDLYRLGIRTGREERLTTLSSSAQEVLPTIFRGEIAFLRKGPRVDRLMIGNTTSGSRGPQTLVALSHDKGRIVGAELSYDRIAYVVERKGASGFGEQLVHVRTLRGRDRVVYRAASGGANAASVTRPSLSDSLKSFVFARVNNASGAGNRIVRYEVRSGRLSYAAGSSRYLSTGYVDAARGVAVFRDDSGTGTCFGNVNDTPDKTQCRVELTGPLTFSARP